MRHILYEKWRPKIAWKGVTVRARLYVCRFFCVLFFSRRLSIAYVGLFIYSFFYSFEPDSCRYSLLFFFFFFSSHITITCVAYFWWSFWRRKRAHAYTLHTLNHHAKGSKQNCLHSMIYHNYYYWNSLSDTCGVAVLHHIHSVFADGKRKQQPKTNFVGLVCVCVYA